jgi:hypothetical protein
MRVRVRVRVRMRMRVRVRVRVRMRMRVRRLSSLRMVQSNPSLDALENSRQCR